MELFDMAGHLVRRLHQKSTHIFQKQAQQSGYELTPVQYAAMAAIHAHPNLDQARVAAMIAYDRATIGGVIDRLEQKGFVKRVVSSRDRRARDVSLTDLGQKILEDISPIVWSMQKEILSGLTEEERKTFLGLARKAVQHDDVAS